MIIVKTRDEAAATAAIEKALRGEEDVEIFQSDTEDYTTEEVMSMLVYNAVQTRKYVGRLERNTRSIDGNLKNISKFLEPLASYVSMKIAEEGHDEDLLAQVRKSREAKVMRENLYTPKIGEKAAREG